MPTKNGNNVTYSDKTSHNSYVAIDTANNTIKASKTLIAGTKISFNYSSTDGGYGGTAEIAITPLKNGFKLQYTTDSSGVTISKTTPQLMVGRNTDIVVLYNTDNENWVSASGYGVSFSLINTSCVPFVTNANGVNISVEPTQSGRNINITYTLKVIDGASAYRVATNNIQVFKPITNFSAIVLSSAATLNSATNSYYMRSESAMLSISGLPSDVTVTTANFTYSFEGGSTGYSIHIQTEQ